MIKAHKIQNDIVGFWHLHFGFAFQLVSDFDIRVSDFVSIGGRYVERETS